MLPFEERKQEECLLAAPRNSSGVQEVLVVIGGICNNKKLKEVDYYNSVKGQSFKIRRSTNRRLIRGSLRSYNRMTTNIIYRMAIIG